jgi:DNA-binding response OmpR family regulator
VDSGEAGIELAAASDFDLVITDIVMPGTEGLETIKQIRRHKPGIKILAVSGGGSSKGDYLHYAERLGANAALAKPFEPVEFLEVVAALIKPPVLG